MQKPRGESNWFAFTVRTRCNNSDQATRIHILIYLPQCILPRMWNIDDSPSVANSITPLPNWMQSLSWLNHVSRSSKKSYLLVFKQCVCGVGSARLLIRQKAMRRCDIGRNLSTSKWLHAVLRTHAIKGYPELTIHISAFYNRRLQPTFGVIKRIASR